MRRLLALVLTVLEPLSLALAASQHLATLVDRGWPSLAFLAFRLGVTGLGLIAGVALWQRRAGARALVRAALALALASSALALTSPLWPGRPPPGLGGPVLALVVIWYSGWFWLTTRIDE